MSRETDVRDLLGDILYETEAEAERLADCLGPRGEDHWMAILELNEAIESPTGIDWLRLNETIAVPWLADDGERLWLSPRTYSFLNMVTTDWAPPTINLVDLVEMIQGDQRHLARHLVHPDDAAVSLGVPPSRVRLLAIDGVLSHVEIEGTAFILDDEALMAAVTDLDARIEECGA